MYQSVETIDGYFDGPDAPPAFEGHPESAHKFLMPGVYRAILTTDYATEVGYLTVWDENSHYPSMGISPKSSGSLFMGLGCGMMGCPDSAPHNHTVAELTGEWWN